jgi:hypothetical protein
VWWVIDSDGHAATNDSDPERRLGMQPELAFLHTRSLLAAARLEVVREQEVAGRPVAIVRASARSAGSHVRWWGFWDEVDAMEIPIDLERGVALGSPYFQVDEISFDEELAPEIFSRPYPESHTTDHGDRSPREMSLDEARALLRFPVLLPRLLPEGARLLRCLVDSEEPPQWVGLVWAIDPGATYTFRLRQGPAVAREAERFQGEEVTEQGVRFSVEGAASEHALLRMFANTGRDWYEVDSDLPLEMIATILLSMQE